MLEWAGVAALITALVGVWKVFDERAVKKNASMLKDIETKLDNLHKEFTDGQLQDRQAITRLELMVLIEHDPENVIEIERLAKHYFCDLEGDRYMSSVYTKYAKKHGADFTFVTH